MSDIRLLTYDKLENKNLFFEFCQQASQEINQPAHTNMWADNWQTRPDTLIYQIYNRHRYFDNGGRFHLALDGGVIVACSGVYKSAFSNEVAFGGCRTWISKEYRHLGLPREIFLPAHKQWAIDNNCKVIAITFNDYNKNLIETFKRKRLGEARSPRQPHHLFYSNFNEVDFPVVIQYTRQWVIYEKLDVTFEFDWTSII
jgi:hypothetical protein